MYNTLNPTNPIAVSYDSLSLLKDYNRDLEPYIAVSKDSVRQYVLAS
jgi:hypothetical protein